jgi:hypothetical protein
MFYYLLVYWLLPMVSFSSVNISMTELIRGVINFTVPEKIGHLASAFYPTGMTDPALSVLTALAEAAIAAAWLYFRIQRYVSASAAAKGGA